MKKIKFFCVLLALALCSCADASDGNVSQTVEIRAESTSNASSDTSVAGTEKSAETLNKYTETSAKIEIPFEELASTRLDEMMTAWINKDEAAWSEYFYGYDSSVSCFKNVDVKSYSVLGAKTYYDGIFTSDDMQLFTIELDILQSNSKWFSDGKSVWNVLLGKSDWNKRFDTMCLYFIPDNFNENDFYPYNNENKYADLGYTFTYSFNCFETVKDIREYCLAMDYETFLDGLRAFVRTADEVTPQIINEWGDPYYSKDDVNAIVSKYLGMTDYSWNENFAGLGGDRLWKVWDMKTAYIIITERTDSYIDLIYFADYNYFTPAKKMRYYFADNDGTVQLLGTELIEDYGYEANWECN